MRRRDFALSGAAALLTASAPAFAVEQEFSRRAREVWRRAVIVDGNIYPPIGSETHPQPQATLDLARNCGLSAVKASIGGFNAPFEDTIAEISSLQRLVEGNPDYFLQIREAADIRRAKRERKLGVIFSFESVAALEAELDRIDLFRGLGVRIMQLSYNLPAPFGAGVLSPPDAGLSELGREAIARMNAQGVALDLSHANAATTAAALQVTTKPALITHAGCIAVHNNPRNKTDEQLRAIAEQGGVVGIYNLFYLAPAGRQPTLEDFMAHMVHALDVCGEDHVGFGSDTQFEGFALSDEDRAAWAAETERRIASGVAAPEEDGRLPYTEGLNRPDRALVIADALLKRGYSDRAVEKVLGGNFIRAFAEIW